MGDGKKLKEYLDERDISVRKIAKQAGISPTTLYSIIQKDSNIRFDFALKRIKVSPSRTVRRYYVKIKEKNRSLDCCRYRRGVWAGNSQ